MGGAGGAFKVALDASARDSFVRVPSALAEELIESGAERVVLVVSWQDWQSGERVSLALGWNGSVSRSGALEVAGELRKGLDDGQEVQVEVVRDMPRVDMVVVEPKTPDDWEMLELNAGYLEAEILNQISVLEQGQEFPLWIYGRQLVRMRVQSIDCGRRGLLVPETNFVVEPKLRKSRAAGEADEEEPLSATAKILHCDRLAGDGPSLRVHPAMAAAHRWSEGLIVLLCSPHPPLVYTDESMPAPYELPSRVALRVHLDERVDEGLLHASEEVLTALQVLPLAQLQVLPSSRRPESADQLSLLVCPPLRRRRPSPSREQVVAELRTLAQEQPQLVVSSGLVLALPSARVVLLLPGLPMGAFVLASSLPLAEEVPVSFPAQLPTFPLSLPEPAVTELVGVASVFRQLRAQFGFVCRYPQLYAGLVGKLCLLSGPSGSGKSALLRALCRAEADAPSYAYAEVLDCGPLANVQLSAARQILTRAFTRAAANAPALLVLENVAFICPAAEEDDSSLRPHQLALALESLVRSTVEPVLVVAPVTAAEALHPALRDLAVCGLALSMEGLAREERAAFVVQHAARKGLALSPALSDLAASITDGFVGADLKAMMERLDPEQLTEAAVLEARKVTTPASLQGVKLASSPIRFESVGGLQGPKTALREVLGWPSQHPQLLRNAPIKLPSGLLLYGPPGSGKSMLASACAEEFGLNYLSVSGPELLSKYIGASEQGVRDLFRRAKQCRPALIVFDEFDSLAPKRGHDSTGVTDRVVNQLLTQLDGVESREGVYVLAVTSRPDLIDPALLRPGRLDRLVYVGMPAADERREILSILGGALELAPELDLPAVAEATADFSGADLQALLHNAQLLAVHDLPALSGPSADSTEPELRVDAAYADGRPIAAADQAKLAALLSSVRGGGAASHDDAVEEASDGGAVRVTQAHLDAALADARPSVSEADRTHFERVYAQFRDSHRDADFQSGPGEGPKQTLK